MAAKKTSSNASTEKETKKTSTKKSTTSTKSKKTTQKNSKSTETLQQVQLVVEEKPEVNVVPIENDPMKEFTEIVSTLIETAKKLAMYDSFGSTAIISCIELMLSKSEQYVQQRTLEDNKNNCNCNSDQKNNVNPYNIPEEIKEDVDDIISKVRANLSQLTSS